MLQLLHHHRTVLGIRDAEPFGLRGEDADFGVAAGHHGGNGIGNRELGLDVAFVILQELCEHRLQAVEEARGESPEVHGDGLLAGERGHHAVLVVPDAVSRAADLAHLLHGSQVAVAVHLANAARHRAVLLLAKR